MAIWTVGNHVWGINNHNEIVKMDCENCETECLKIKQGENDMAKMTINQAMTLMKLVRTKKARLEQLQHQVATKEKTWMNEVVKEVTPQYDFTKLDGIIAQYEKFLFKADAAIKQSNAVTEIEVGDSVDALLGALP